LLLHEEFPQVVQFDSQVGVISVEVALPICFLVMFPILPLDLQPTLSDAEGVPTLFIHSIYRDKLTSKRSFPIHFQVMLPEPALWLALTC
jgi:hypothetical protein